VRATVDAARAGSSSALGGVGFFGCLGWRVVAKGLLQRAYRHGRAFRTTNGERDRTKGHGSLQRFEGDRLGFGNCAAYAASKTEPKHVSMARCKIDSMNKRKNAELKAHA